MNFDSIMGWCTLGGTIGSAAGILVGAAVGINRESVGKSREDAIADAVADEDPTGGGGL